MPAIVGATRPTVASRTSTNGDKSSLAGQYTTEMGIVHTSIQALKERIALHYDVASDYYLNLWGEHIHHGYYPSPESKIKDTKEIAQLNLIRLLLDSAQIKPKTGERLNVLDVGCGVGGTSRYLASELDCAVTGVTISGKQVDIAHRLTKNAAIKRLKLANEVNGLAKVTPSSEVEQDVILLGLGSVRYVELDAERMGDYFSDAYASFDIVWISEALSHFPNKRLFFENAMKLLRPGGKLVIADWFVGDGVAADNVDIKTIEDGMLLPPLSTQQGYVDLAMQAGLEILSEPNDISQDVSKTWEISWSLVQNPSLWSFAFSQGRDGIAFLQSFRAMRRGYANGSFRYAVMAFGKPINSSQLNGANGH